MVIRLTRQAVAYLKPGAWLSFSELTWKILYSSDRLMKKRFLVFQFNLLPSSKVLENRVAMAIVGIKKRQRQERAYELKLFDITKLAERYPENLEAKDSAPP